MGEDGNAHQVGTATGGTNRPNTSLKDPGSPEKQIDKEKGHGDTKSSHGATTASKTPWLMAPGRFGSSAGRSAPLIFSVFGTIISRRL
jgi:hypothetical protein